jgi:hypothetical protein
MNRKGLTLHLAKAVPTHHLSLLQVLLLRLQQLGWVLEFELLHQLESVCSVREGHGMTK